MCWLTVVCASMLACVHECAPSFAHASVHARARVRADVRTCVCACVHPNARLHRWQRIAYTSHSSVDEAGPREDLGRSGDTASGGHPSERELHLSCVHLHVLHGKCFVRSARSTIKEARSDVQKSFAASPRRSCAALRHTRCRKHKFVRMRWACGNARSCVRCCGSALPPPYVVVRGDSGLLL